MTRVKVKRYTVNIKHTNKPSRIYSTPSFLVGMGSIFNIGGNYYEFNYFNTPSQSDSNAIAHDWTVVGRNMKKVLGQL